MGVAALLLRASVAALAISSRPADAARIIQANDDGWAELYLRSLHDALLAAGHDAVVSAPADNESARSSLDVDPANRTAACQYNSCPANSNTATGTNASAPRLNWVNSFPATAMRLGIEQIAPGVWGDATPPELAVTGPNVGSNVGFVQVEFSGTVGAACKAVDLGVPAVAFSGLTAGNAAWDADPVPARSLVYADVAANLTGALLDAGAPFLPDGTFLNVNMAEVDEQGGACTDPAAFRFVLSRINARTPLSSADVETCGSDELPTEKTVVDTAGGCYVAVSVGDCSDKTTSGAANQQAVLDKLGSLLTCLPS